MYCPEARLAGLKSPLKVFLQEEGLSLETRNTRGRPGVSRGWCSATGKQCCCPPLALADGTRRRAELGAHNIQGSSTRAYSTFPKLNFDKCWSTALCFIWLILLEGSSHILLTRKSPEISYHVLITWVSLNILVRLQTGKLTERRLKHFRSAVSLIWYKQLNGSPKEAGTACYFNTQTQSDNSSKCLSFQNGENSPSLCPLQPLPSHVYLVEPVH